MSAPEPALIAQGFVAACRDELDAPKPGNVHVFAAGHRMAAEDFMASADVAALPLAARGASVGERIYGAVAATIAKVAQNTNLGIVLLCAPLAHAALNYPDESLQDGVARVLQNLDRGDAELAFKAIALANPAGLGSAERHDVSQPVQASLLEAMREAAPRDRIAFQYATGFGDVFNLGLGALFAARRRGCEKDLATLRVYLAFLGGFPDSHVARKFGVAASAALCAEARDFTARIDLARREAAFKEALRFDSELKRRGLNPGTSADLTVATLFADYLTCVLANRFKNG